MVEVLCRVGRHDDQCRQVFGSTERPGRHDYATGGGNLFVIGREILPAIKRSCRQAIGRTHRIDHAAEWNDRITVNQQDTDGFASVANGRTPGSMMLLSKLILSQSSPSTTRA